MSARGDQVQQLLSLLERHKDLIAEAFEGPISGGERRRNDAIEALFGIGALKPHDEDSYRLNPRLREFFSDHLASYHAFQALRVVRSTVVQARTQWHELRRLRQTSGSINDQNRLMAGFEESISEVVYSIEHNLSMLHSLISTQYGNVENIVTKLRQNRYYRNQVVGFMSDVRLVSTFADMVIDEAVAAGAWEVRQIAVRRIASRIHQWTSQIKDAQAVITDRLFKAAKMQHSLRLLSRYSLWLSRHRTAAGWEIDVDESVPVALVPVDPVDFRPQPDVADDDPVIISGLLMAVARLPKQEARSRTIESDEPQVLIADGNDVVYEAPDPVRQAVIALSVEASSSPKPISLLRWKSGRPELGEIGDESWLLFASLQLRSTGLVTRFASGSFDDPFEINVTFSDVEVSPT